MKREEQDTDILTVSDKRLPISSPDRRREHGCEYSQHSQHMWPLNGGGRVGAEIEAPAAPEMAAKMLGLDFVKGAK